ncbi:MAG: AAA family ATPase, partial [Alphaproteobacteria bacterium]|nr:AAA family ATPase [Alphaproteobacteria bacterium]
LYGRDYIRKFLTATVAPGGVGKSTLVLAEAISMASGSPILGHVPEGGKIKPSQLRVGYFNAEDPMDEIQRRVLATCEHHFVSQAALADRLWLASGRDHPLLLMEGDDGAVNEAALEFLHDFALAYDLDVLIFDPLANMTTSPETNDVFRQLTARLNRLAGDTETAVHIVHHTRKLQPGMAASDNDARGGRALVDGARSVRVLNHMSKEEAAKAGLDTGIDHFRSEDAKANLARRADRAAWFERVSVKLDNGDHVATIVQWSWPDAFDGISSADLLAAQRAIAGLTEPAKRSSQARGWAGHIIGGAIGMDTSDAAMKARVKVMLDKWIATGAFAIEDVMDTRNGRKTPVIVVGTWADDN